MSSWIAQRSICGGPLRTKNLHTAQFSSFSIRVTQKHISQPLRTVSSCFSHRQPLLMNRFKDKEDFYIMTLAVVEERNAFHVETTSLSTDVTKRLHAKAILFI
jgi:hypothetical protein